MYLIFTFLLIYSISRYADVSCLAAYEGCAPYCYLTFHFVHTSLYHLFVNSLVIAMYWRLLRRQANNCYSIPLIAVSSVWAGILSVSATPTIGASAIAFSMVAVFCVGLFFERGIKNKAVIRMYAILTAFVLVQSFFMPGINVKIHLLSFAFAAILSILFRKKLYVRL